MDRHVSSKDRLRGRCVVVAVSLTVALAACQPGDFEGHNNHAVLEGSPVGYDVEANADLRKRIDVDLGSSNGAFEVEQVYATRASAQPDADAATSIVFVVTNTGYRAHCFVCSEPIVLYDVDGNELESIEVGFVNGSVGRVSTGPFSAVQICTCLAVGERGFFGIFTGSAYADLARVSLSLESSSNDMIASPQAAVLPLQYSFSLNSGLVVDVENQGAVAASLEAARYMLLDDQDQPLGWGMFLDLEPGGGALHPDEPGTLGVAVLNFFGTAARVWVSVAFEDLG